MSGQVLNIQLLKSVGHSRHITRSSRTDEILTQAEFSSAATQTQFHFHCSNNEFFIQTKAKINDVRSYMFFAKCILKCLDNCLFAKGLTKITF